MNDIMLVQGSESKWLLGPWKKRRKEFDGPLEAVRSLMNVLKERIFRSRLPGLCPDRCFYRTGYGCGNGRKEPQSCNIGARSVI